MKGFFIQLVMRILPAPRVYTVSLIEPTPRGQTISFFEDCYEYLYMALKQAAKKDQ